MKSLEKDISIAIADRSRSLNYYKTLFAIAMLVTAAFSAYSQDFPNGYNNQNGYDNRQNEVTDQSLVQAIAPYNEDVRNDILIATQYPDILEELSQIRDHTTRAFQATIRNYPQKKQNWFYEISRYPQLMDKLATMPRRKSKGEIESLLSNPTEELKEAAWKLYANHHDDLVTVNNLNQQALISFQELINPLSRNAQTAFRTLQEMPDVLSLLNDHIDIASRLGERFRNDPSGTSQQLAEVHDQLDSQNKQDLASYQDELAQNPQAWQELGQASRDYASTGGYSYPAPTQDKVINYGSPYSYWFGYPVWYSSPMWYPGAFGYGSGIYFGFGGYPSIYGLPSLGFSRWFFGGAYRRYPNLYRQYGRYYSDNVGRGRYVSPNRSAFMGTANRHFVPNMSGRSSGFNNNQAYRQSRSMAASQNYRVAPRQSYSGGNSVRSYSRPSYGSGSNRGFGGGGYGGGFHGGGGRGGRR